jgi:hypothetical protein
MKSGSLERRCRFVGSLIGWCEMRGVMSKGVGGSVMQRWDCGRVGLRKFGRETEGLASVRMLLEQDMLVEM